MLAFSLMLSAQKKAATLPKSGNIKVDPKSNLIRNKVKHGERKSGRLNGKSDVDLINEKVEKSGIRQTSVAGIDVISKPSTKEVVNLKMFIRGGTGNFDLKQEGIEALTLTLLTDGLNSKYSKEEYFAKLEGTGTSLFAETQYDYSLLDLTCLKDDWSTALDLFDAAIFHPSFNEQDFERVRNQMIAAAQQTGADPDNYLRNAAMKHTFKGMNYEKLQEGTEESLNSISLEDVKEYYRKIIASNKIFFVLVGDVTAESLDAKLGSSLGKLQPFIDRGKLKEAPFQLTKNEYEITERDVETNYIRGYMMAPPVGSTDEFALRMAMSILRDRLFLEVRTKRNLSYAPNSFYPTSVVGNPYLAVYVTTIEPDTTIKVIKNEIQKLRTEGFSDKELRDRKQGWLTQHYMGQETNSAQGMTLGVAHLVGSWEQSLLTNDLVQRLTAKRLTEAFRKYTEHISWTYVGKGAQVDPKVMLAPFPQD